MGKIGWVEMRAQTWQPRVLSDFAFAVLLFHLPVWKVLNAAMVATLLWVVTRTATYGWGEWAGVDAGQVGNVVAARRAFLMFGVIVCLGLFLIHPNVITSGSVWFTGSFYYLWPTTAMLLGLAPFLLLLYGKALPYPSVLTPLCFIFSLCACQTEQAAAVQLGVAILLLLRQAVKRLPIPRVLIAQFVVIAAASAVFFYFDFTSTRVTQQPESRLFSEFAQFNLIDKLMLGVNVYTTHLLHVSNIIFTILLVFAGWLAFRHIGQTADGGHQTRLVARASMFLPALWALVNTLPLPWGYTQMTSQALAGKPGALGIGDFGWLGFLYSTSPMASSPSAGGVLLSVLALICALSPLYLLIRAFHDKRDQYLSVVLYLASLASGILIGFSPSVWASESRPNYISNVIMLLLLAMLVRTKLKPVGASDTATPAPGMSLFLCPRCAIVSVCVLGAFAVYVIVLYFTTFATNAYWWY